ncbi:hypothetical protein N0V83_006733 [Neocucurbitaria cava]|uniref:Rhodopsin domain-containing protein n=1 Tax=Neocucurbitaria cava TaxID=798079 RepID=A0A9W8Y5L9_9PLEO|nr:hypothetical protein N0V83_006733 [Neocucurbitaria cava]
MTSLAIPPGVDLTKVPLAANPSGAPPNFVDSPSLAAVTYGMTCTMMVLAYSLVALRLNKTSHHAWDTPISSINATWFKRNAALCLLYGPAMFFAKTAVCTLYLRIFNTVVWMRYTVIGAIVFFGCTYFSMVPVYIAFSFPYGDEQWDLPLAAKVGRADRMAIVTGVINVISDIFLLTIPLPIIMKLNLSLRKRLGLAAVFLTGIIATIATILGLYYRIQLYRSKKNADGGDATWVAAATYITVLVELFVAIMVSCVPGCVSSWRNVLRETSVITSLRSLISTSRASLRGSRGSSRDVRGKSPSIQSDEADLTPKHKFELPDRREKDVGITKTIKIQQSEV